MSSFDCAFPDAWIDVPSCSVIFLASSRFILSIRTRSRGEPWDGNQLYYLYIYNRLTRAWSAPIQFPDEYAFYLKVNVHCVAIVEPRTVVALCVPHRGRMFSLVRFGISEGLDALSVLSRTELGMYRQVDCTGLFPSAHGFTCALSTMDEERRTTAHVFRFRGAAIASKACYETADWCTFATMHEGTPYLVGTGSDDTPFPDRLYRCNGARLEIVASFAEIPQQQRFIDDCRVTTPLQFSACGSRIFYSFVYYDQTSEIVTMAFDVCTERWQPGARFSLAGLTFGAYWIACEPVGDEVLVSVELDDPVADGGFRRGFRSLWFQPPALSAIALGAVHKCLSDRTADRLARQRHIVSDVQLFKFLYAAV